MKKESSKKIDADLADLVQRTRETVQKVMATLTKIRLQIAERKSERNHIEHLPVSVEEAIRIINDRIDNSASEFNDYLPGLVHDSYPLIVESIDGKQDRTAAFICCVLGPEIKKNISIRIRQSWAKETIMADDRSTQLFTLAAEIRELEKQEESICCELEEFGTAVNRRPDLDPEVFLEVREEDEKV